MKQMVLFTLVMQQLTSFVMSSRKMQDFVKLGLTDGAVLM
jgi:hypothetical protein